MPDITLRTRDGARLAFPCAAGTNVVDAAEAAGLYLPAMCHEGTCGACHAHVVEGTYSLRAEGNGAPSDVSVGGVPLCRCNPTTDLVIDAPYSETDIARQKRKSRIATIIDLTPVGSGVIALGLSLAPDPELGVAADFLPGQYMQITIPGTGIRRAYSLANLPNWDGRLEFLVRLQPGGAFSTWLANKARPGDTLELDGPFGHFVLDEASPRPRILVGGGCGFAPVLSMLRHLASCQDLQVTTLIFGANREDELFGTEAIEALREALPMLRVTLCVWRPEGRWDGFVGTAADALAVTLDGGE